MPDDQLPEGTTDHDEPNAPTAGSEGHVEEEQVADYDGAREALRQMRANGGILPEDGDDPGGEAPADETTQVQPQETPEVPETPPAPELTEEQQVKLRVRQEAQRLRNEAKKDRAEAAAAKAEAEAARAEAQALKTQLDAERAAEAARRDRAAKDPYAYLQEQTQQSFDDLV